VSPYAIIYLKEMVNMTLTELICCVVILSILAMITMPMILGYIDEAKITTDRANAKVIENIIIRAHVSGNDIRDKNIVEDFLIKELGEIPKIQSQGNFQYNYNTGRVSITTRNIPDINCYLLTSNDSSDILPTPTPTNEEEDDKDKDDNGNHYGQDKGK